jgi:hypothetical protein
MGMRRYSVVSPLFWLARSTTGSAIRSQGHRATLAALYLITNPHANMLGLYDLPLTLLCHETGFTEAQAREALAKVQAAGFAEYSEAEETVWVPGMARFQVGSSLKPGDTKRIRLERDLASFEGTAFYDRFLARYGEPYGLKAPLGVTEDGEDRLARAQQLDRMLEGGGP